MDSKMKNHKKCILLIVCLVALLGLLLMVVILRDGKNAEDADKKQDNATEELFIDASYWQLEDEKITGSEDVEQDLDEENDTFEESNSQDVTSPKPTVGNNLQDKEENEPIKDTTTKNESQDDNSKEHKGWFYNFCF